jgi:adenylosuccinate lyase
MLDYEGFAGLRQAASPRMYDIWNLIGKFQMERELWVAVMEAQQALGFAIPQEAIEAYRANIRGIDLASINRREQVTHHDVKARLEEFNALAGRQFAHLGMTGRDLDDNVELLQQRLSLELLSQRAAELGQPSIAADLGRLATKVKFRGIVGAVGTGQDQLDLLGGDPRALQELNDRVQKHLGFAPGARLDSVGQVYPRSLDYFTASSLTATLSALPKAASGATSPYPTIARGYVSMLAELSGDQWAEGDVSCSVVRRVALEGVFLCASARLEQLVEG